MKRNLLGRKLECFESNFETCKEKRVLKEILGIFQEYCKFVGKKPYVFVFVFIYVFIYLVFRVFIPLKHRM